MALPQGVWNQLKSKTADDLIAALKRDGFEQDPASKGAQLAFIKRSTPGTAQRIVIHYHPKKTYGPRLLKGLLDDIGWDDADLKRLKLVK